MRGRVVAQSRAPGLRSGARVGHRILRQLRMRRARYFRWPGGIRGLLFRGYYLYSPLRPGTGGRRRGGTATRLGAPLLDYKLPHFQQHVPERPSFAAAHAVLRIARDVPSPAAAGQLLHDVLRGAHSAAFAVPDGPSTRRLGGSPSRSELRTSLLAACGTVPIKVLGRKRPLGSFA